MASNLKPGEAQSGAPEFDDLRALSPDEVRLLADLGREWPDGVILGIRVDGEQAKAAAIETYPDVFFTIPHFDGFPAVLTRLDAIDEQLLREMLTDAWLLRVPKTVATAWLAERGLAE